MFWEYSCVFQDNGHAADTSVQGVLEVCPKSVQIWFFADDQRFACGCCGWLAFKRVGRRVSYWVWSSTSAWINSIENKILKKQKN